MLFPHMKSKQQVFFPTRSDLIKMMSIVEKRIPIEYVFCFLFLWYCYSCTLTPRMAIPQELKNELVRTGRYNSYVRYLNQSLDSNNAEDLSYFLSIDYFCTFSTGSEHGQILLDILREKGDTLFFKALTLLNQSEKINVKGYILIGIDNQKKYNISNLIKEYPKSFGYLNIKPW